MKIEKRKQQLRQQQQQQQQQLNMQNNTQQLLPYSDNQVKEINHYNYNQRRGSLPQPPRVQQQPSVQTYPPSAGASYHNRSKTKAINGFQHPAMINHKSSNSVVKNNRQREQLYYIQNFHPEMLRNYEGMSCSSSQSGGSVMLDSRHRQQVSSVGSYDEMESEIMSPPSPPPNSIFEPIDAKRKR